MDKNYSTFSEDIDGVIDFNSPQVTDDTYSKILSIILSQTGKIDAILKLYNNSSDKKYFDDNTIEHIEKRLNKFIKGSTPKEKKLKYKEAQYGKTPNSDVEVFEFTVGATITSQQEAIIKKIHSETNNSTKDKLNFIR